MLETLPKLLYYDIVMFQCCITYTVLILICNNNGTRGTQDILFKCTKSTVVENRKQKSLTYSPPPIYISHRLGHNRVILVGTGAEHTLPYALHGYNGWVFDGLSPGGMDRALNRKRHGVSIMLQR
jgi:hypothetical protein